MSQPEPGVTSRAVAAAVKDVAAQGTMQQRGHSDAGISIANGAKKGPGGHLDALEALHQKTSSQARKFLETAVVVALWFVFNISLANFTKWLFLYGRICMEEVPAGLEAEDVLGPDGNQCVTYKFPLAITVVHMLFSWAVCHVHIYYIRKTPKTSGLPFAVQVSRIAPLAACFSLSVAMGNLSLKYIFPSFNQMLGSMSPLITVLIATVMPPRKRYNAWTWASMPVICGGLVVCTTKEVNFHALGAFYAIGATVLRAVKSIIQGRLLDPAETKLDSVTLLYYMAPFSALLLFICSVYSEGLEPYTLLMPRLRANSFEESPVTGVGHVLALLVLSGFNACALNIMNFLVTSYTGPVTLQVLGNVKSCASIAVSVAIFGNDLKLSQVFGVSTCLVGVWIYTNKGGSVKAPAVEAPKQPAAALTEMVSTSKLKDDIESAATSIAKSSQEAIDPRDV